jgi:hypothetical protein
MTQHDQAQQAAVLYTENHSAVRWLYFLHIALWTFLLVIGVAAMAWSRNPSLSFVPTIGGLGALIMGAITIIAWPTGIQVRSDGIRVGGIHRTQRPDRHLPSVNARWKRPFFCPWPAIRSAEIVTDRAYIRRTNKDFREPGKVALGMFRAPFTRSALFLEVNINAVTIPEFRPPDTERPFFRPANFTVPFTSPVWLIPTKHPEALRAAIAQHVSLRPSTPTPGAARD